jgi:thiamine-monophosphate kinase
VEDVVEMYRGMDEVARKYDVAIAGGDTCRAPVVSVTVSVVGRAWDGGVLKRFGAKPGDVVAVTGCLGGAAAGLEMLRNGMSFGVGETERLRRAFLLPEPRIAEGRLLAEQGVKAAIDISDGLIADLRHICRQSGVGARVHTDRLPVHPSARVCFPARAVELALGGGEDYELLFTAGKDIIEEVKAKFTCAISEIGEVVTEHTGEVRLLAADGSALDLRGQGWEHFRPEK